MPCVAKVSVTASDIWRIPETDIIPIKAIMKTERSAANRNLREWNIFIAFLQINIVPSYLTLFYRAIICLGHHFLNKKLPTRRNIILRYSI
jgi:hypothetical protein